VRHDLRYPLPGHRLLVVAEDALRSHRLGQLLPDHVEADRRRALELRQRCADRGGTRRTVGVLLQLALVLHQMAHPRLAGGVVLAFVWANRLLPGMALVFLGFAANAAVITANGAMPVDEAARREGA
jgi:hypothetical protein